MIHKIKEKEKVATLLRKVSILISGPEENEGQEAPVGDCLL